MPGGRYAGSSWSGKDGNFWLLGGLGVDSTGTPGEPDDLWEFDTASGRWIWMGGSNTLPGRWENVPTTFGTKGVAAPGNSPGSRTNSNHWTDSNGNLWLFSGSSEGNTNDLWKFEPASNLWTWVGGQGSLPTWLIGVPGDYGILGKAADTNMPGTRGQAQSCTDPAGRFWLLGGGGVDSVDNVGLENDPPPTLNSPVYAGQTLNVTKTVAVEAIAVADGHAVSRIMTGQYSLPIAFTIAATPTTLSLSGGTSGTVALKIAPQDGFNAPVTFSCAGLPAGATCAFSPASVTPTGGAVSTTLTIATAANRAAAVRTQPMISPTVIALGVLIFGWRRRRGSSLMVIALVFAALGALVACGGGGGSSGGGGGTQPMTWPVTVSGLTTGEFEQTTVTLVVN